MRRSHGPGAPGAAIALTLGLVCLAALGCGRKSQRARAPAAPGAPHAYSLGVRLSRGGAQLGEPVVYQGWITGGSPGRMRFLLPDSGGAFTWGPLHTRLKTPRSRPVEIDTRLATKFADYDSVFVEAELQAFALGDITIPGIEFELDDGSGPRRGRLPVTKLVVAPVLTAADSAADLRALRGPLGAPWWERVAWTMVALTVLGLAAAAAAVVWLRRRRRAALPVAAPVVARDPAALALAELEALRRRDLPARGRFADHAFQLGRIVRRFLEAAAGTPLPGDTTPEFVRHLEASTLDSDARDRIGTLMRFWDQVKFARAAASVEQATRAEHTVEGLVRRFAPRAAGPEPSPPLPEGAA